MMKKVSQYCQNLPMMPNFGGECKTTGLVRKVVQVAYEKSAETYRIRSCFVCYACGKDFSRIMNFRFTRPDMGNQ